MNFFQTLSAAIVEQSTMIYLHADAARGFSPLDVPPPRRVLPFVKPAHLKSA